jgi:hypothetical protein
MLHRSGTGAALAACAILAFGGDSDAGGGAPQSRSLASVAGRVVDGRTGRGIADATVTIDAQGRVQATARTDSAGRFKLSMPPGTHRLTATRAGFEPGSWGQYRSADAHRPLDVLPGQEVRNLTVTLWASAIVAGEVKDEQGEPVPGVQVAALQRRVDLGGPRLVVAPARRETTDDNGRYRLSALPPGTYTIAVVGGSVGLDLARSSAGDPGHSTVFYPNAASPAGAADLTVDAGQELNGIDFRLVPEPSRTIAGIIETLVAELDTLPTPRQGSRR